MVESMDSDDPIYPLKNLEIASSKESVGVQNGVGSVLISHVADVSMDSDGDPELQKIVKDSLFTGSKEFVGLLASNRSHEGVSPVFQVHFDQSVLGKESKSFSDDETQHYIIPSSSITSNEQVRIWLILYNRIP
ncbi:hypothetical protein L2E82_34166 [Cichorium intybus]|uniref:Uncharacterized protein n=1 Tax=Cichorium intybus TaxID=13427 RepID=A0ACB9BLP1_CICIN|nr:hypothetical protein L2E82_34166 [Cichorium intybus]